MLLFTVFPLAHGRAVELHSPQGRPPLSGSIGESIRNGPLPGFPAGRSPLHATRSAWAESPLSPRHGTGLRIRTSMLCRPLRAPRVAGRSCLLEERFTGPHHAHDPHGPAMSTIARSASRRLGELLMERSGLRPEQVAHALTARTDPRERLGQALVRLGHLDERTLVDALAHQFALPVADAQRLTTANREAVQLVPEQLARQAQVLAFAKQGVTLEVAVGDPLDVLSLDHLRALTGCALRVWVAQPSELAEAIEQFYSELRATEHLGEILDNIDVTGTGTEEEV